jgi:photosystem II stability/assembly factor-like uncharacterized protein
MSRATLGFLALACCLYADIALAQLSVTIRDINPDRSNSTARNASTGGRVNGLDIDPTTPARVYAASEWGGLWRSTDNGLTWQHLDGHVPTNTVDVKVDPTNSNRIYATSSFDGRVNSRSGINISTDAGVTWTHPATATPPLNFCTLPVQRTELAAWGIAVDPANANRVFIGTNCGLAISSDAGATWSFVDPTPADGADNVYDVIVHDGGIIDLCSDDGHRRSTDGGTTWTTATSQPLPSAQCSITVSPDEAYVLIAVAGTTVFESDNGGQTWAVNYGSPETRQQGRIPFVATNQRAGATFDLWFGDVGLWRATCTTPSPAAQGGTRRCTAVGAWTALIGQAHDDVGDIVFAPGVASDACPRFFSSDGGVFRNTATTSPGCHAPTWAQPTVTPHALWNYSFTAVPQPGAATEHLYIGNQDDGTVGALNGGATPVTWNNERCCDGFDTAGDGTRALTTTCCNNTPGARLTRLWIGPTGLTGGSTEINTYPGGNMRTFEHLEAIVTYAANSYVIATTTGVFLTTNIGASTVAWTQLGPGSSPANACGLQFAMTGGTPTFFVKSGGCDGDQQGTLWRYQGTAGTGTWQQVPNPAIGSFGVYAVDRNDPQRIIASNLGGVNPRMVMTRNGGTIWSPLPALDTMMTGGGTFLYTTQTGAVPFALNGYPQPTLVAFDPADPDILVAGGADSGVFISTNGGTRWQLVTDPVTPGTSGVPHIPRPYYAFFDHDPPAGDINLFLGTRGRGVWRLTFKKVLMPEITVPSPPAFTASCLGDKQPAPLRVCNTSGGDLVVASITSSNPEFAITSPSGGFPVTISHDFCFPFEVAFTPTQQGTRTTNFTINSNDPNFPTLTVAATAAVGAPTAVTAIVDTGNFGEFCPGPNAFKDLDIIVDNRGTCPLLITSLTSSSPEFQVPQVLTFPIKVAPGDNIALPFRFQPTSAGAKSATLTLATNDPAGPKLVTATGSVPPPYVCSPPLFTSLEAAVGPTFGTGRTGNYTVNSNGRFLGSFGPNRTFGVQVQGEYMFYPGRHEGQVDTALLYRRGLWQAAVAGSFKTANLRAEVGAGALTDVAGSFDIFLPTIRFGAFGSKGLKETDVVGLSERVGAAAPGGAPILVLERVAHTVDSLGGDVQLNLVPGSWWLDANAAFLNRHAPGVSNTAGAAVRVSNQALPWLVAFAQLDINESFISAHTVGTVTVGVTIGRWPKPQDWSNPVNPLGTLIPRIHYEVFDRVR